MLGDHFGGILIAAVAAVGASMFYNYLCCSCDSARSDQEDDSDIVYIVIEGQKFSANKAVLEANSRYFRRLLRENENFNQVVLTDVGDLALSVCLQFCYTQRAELTEAIVFDVLFAAKYLQIDALEETCWVFISGVIRPENVFTILEFAQQSNGRADLLEKCFRCIVANFSEVCYHTNLFDYNQLIAFCDNARKIGHISDNQLLHVIEHWVNSYPGHRQLETTNLLDRYFDLKSLSVDFLWEYVRPICKDADSRKLFEEAIDYHVLVLNLKQTDRTLNPEKTSTVNKFKILLRITKGGSKFLYSFCPKTKSFSKIALLKQGDWIHCNVRWGDQVVDHNKKQVKLYHLMSDEWTDLPETKDDVLYSFIWNNQLHVLTSPLEVFKYNLTTSSWTIVGSGFPRRRCEYGASFAVLDNKLYVMGGMNKQYSMKCYNLTTLKWLVLANPPTCRCSAKLVAHNGFIYAFGGRTSRKSKGPLVKTVERFDPRQNKFTSLDDWALDDLPVSAVAHDNEIYVTTKKHKIVKYNSTNQKTEVLVNYNDMLKGYSASFVAT